MADANSTPRPRPPKVPAPVTVPHVYVQKGLGTGKTEKR